MNLDSLKQRRDILCLKFAKPGIKYEKLKDFLPEQVKHENIRTRTKTNITLTLHLQGVWKIKV